MPDVMRKQYLHSIGVCVRCKNKDAYTMTGRWYCAECAEIEKNRQRIYREKNKDKINSQHKKYIDSKIASGKCRDCSRPAYKDFTFCKYHLSKRRNDKRKFKEEGKCIWCDNFVIEGYHYCEKCLERKREIIANNRTSNFLNHPWKEWVSTNV